jgi:hypothetical protein
MLILWKNKSISIFKYTSSEFGHDVIAYISPCPYLKYHLVTLSCKAPFVTELGICILGGAHHGGEGNREKDQAGRGAIVTYHYLPMSQSSQIIWSSHISHLLKRRIKQGEELLLLIITCLWARAHKLFGAQTSATCWIGGSSKEGYLWGRAHKLRVAHKSAKYYERSQDGSDFHRCLWTRAHNLRAAHKSAINWQEDQDATDHHCLWARAHKLLTPHK